MLFRVEDPGTWRNWRNETGRDIFSVQRNRQGMVFKNGPSNLQVQDLLLFKSHSAWNFGLPSGKCTHQNVIKCPRSKRRPRQPYTALPDWRDSLGTRQRIEQVTGCECWLRILRIEIRTGVCSHCHQQFAQPCLSPAFAVTIYVLVTQQTQAVHPIVSVAWMCRMRITERLEIYPNDSDEFR